MRAEENRPGIADAPGQTFGVLARDLEMLGRDRIDERQCLIERADQDDGAEVTPGRRGDGGARE